ncbi:glycosyltransferase [Abyssalbus ytuae]|uniref:Glycosyltransferase n=1 Tax=Abyssalbus ytuae TaxID=2926907 RepID=A0A9E7CYX4_9FLAO|nr:glycosyltransferase [Abyssalbus ytuae]UOB17080.1 glycosyltransferase [Abyssalbus ytuae]
MIKISIVIPVYNVQDFVERCIRSVAEQNLSSHLYEIIIINDGTQDNSLEIAQRVAKQFNNIHIYSQQNSGLGASRNKGINLAKGEYIWFVDSDDFIKKDCFKEIFDILTDEKPDVLAFDFNCTDEEGKIIKWIDFKLQFDNKKTLTGPEFYELNYNNSYIWLYLFKKDLFTNNNVYFKNRINMQDSEILPRIMLYVKNILFYDKVLYYYVNRKDSFINTNDPQVRKKYYNSILKVNFYLNRFRDTLSKNNLMFKAISKKQKHINKILFLQYIHTNFSENDLKEIIKNLRKARLYPFKSFNEPNFRKKIIYIFGRILLNIHPVYGRKIYLKLKTISPK